MKCVICGHSLQRDGYLAVRSTEFGPMCTPCIDEAIRAFYKDS